MLFVISFAFSLYAAGMLPQQSASRGDNAPQESEEKQSPSFVLSNLQGRKVSSSDLKGRYTLLDFWATWCPPCRQSIPELVKLQADYKGKGFQVVGVNLDEPPESVPLFVKKFKISYPILLGGNTNIMNRFGVQALPSFFLIDPQGRIVKTWVGFGEELPQEWRRFLDRLL